MFHYFVNLMLKLIIMKNIIIVLLLIFSFQQISAQEELNNQSVIDLIELGFNESVIVAKIESSTTNFNTSIDKLKELKNKGLSSIVLTAMIKSSKKENVESNKSKASLPKLNDTEFMWKDGYDNIVKVDFRVSDTTGLSKVFIGKIVYGALLKAEYSLKNKLSFVPRSIVLDYDKKRGNYAWVTFLGKNSYGAEGEENYYYKFNPKTGEEKLKLDASKIDYKNDPNKEVFRYEKYRAYGMKMKQKGGFIIGENYLVTIIYATKFSPKIETQQLIEKKYDNNNNWTATITGVLNGVDYSFKYSFDRNNNKYKNDGGVLTLESAGTIIEYLLIKMQ